MDINIYRKVNVSGIQCHKCNTVFKIGFCYINTNYPLWSIIHCPNCKNEIGLLKKNDGHPGSVFGGFQTVVPKTDSRIDACFFHIEKRVDREAKYFCDENLDYTTLNVIPNKIQITPLKNIDNKELLLLAPSERRSMPKKDKQNQLIDKFGNRFFEKNKKN